MSALVRSQEATKKGKDNKIFNVFLEERLIPMPINHRLSKTASLWKIHELNWNKYPNTNWIIKPHEYSPNHWIRKEISTDELYKLIFLQPREPTEREKQQMANRMGAELRAFMGTPPVGGVRELQDRAVVFPDNTHLKCKKTLGEVLNFLESRYNTVYTQLGRDRNKKKPRFRMSRKRCPPGCVKKSPKKSSRKRKSVKRSRKRKSVKRSRKRKSVKRSRKRKSVKRSRKRKSVKRSRKKVIRKSKNPIPYDEDWAKGFVTHIGPGGGGGRNNYTGAKKVPTRRILDARKKLIDKIYLLHDQLVALDSSLAKDMFTGEILNPTEWRDPPQYMDRDDLKHYVKIMTADVKSEKQKLKKSHKFSVEIEMADKRNYIKVGFCATCPGPIDKRRIVWSQKKYITRQEAEGINKKQLDDRQEKLPRNQYCHARTPHGKCGSPHMFIVALPKEEYLNLLEKQQREDKKKLKFSSGKKRVGKRARGKYHKRDKRDKSRRRKRDKSRRRKRDKSRRRKKKTKFSAGNKIPVTHEADKKLSKAAKAWRKASMDCFAENGKARRKVSKLVKKLRKCSRNLTLSRELLKASKKSRKHKFRNGDGEKKKIPKTFMDCWQDHVGPGNVVTDKNAAELRTCVWNANALRYSLQQLGKPPVEPHQRGDLPGKPSDR